MKRPALVSALANEALELRRADAFCRVGIDGVDGSGKTFLADELAVALEAHGVPVARVSVDGFHHPRDIRYSKGRESPEGFFRDSYDYDRFIALVLRPFSSGGTGFYTPAVYAVADERPVPPVSVQASDGSILIVDGIFLHRDELAPFWDYSIWLEVPFEISVPRGAERGFGSADPTAPENRRYVDGQRLYIRECAPRQRATVIIDNTDLDNPSFVKA